MRPAAGACVVDDAAFRRAHRRALIDDQVTGASQLARSALDSLAEYAGTAGSEEAAGLRAQLLEFAEELQFARPSMAPVYNLVQRWADRVERLPGDDIEGVRRGAGEIAQALSDESIAAVDLAARATAEAIPERAVVITHSLSSTVQATFRALRHHDVGVIVTESRPGMEGREQARVIAGLGFDVTFVTDAQMALFAGRASLALVGADTVLADGSVVNKAGTYLLALAARAHGIPFRVCCESFKHAPFYPGGFELEEKSAAELQAPRHARIHPRNVYFDITPAALVDAWITDRGIRQNRA